MKQKISILRLCIRIKKMSEMENIKKISADARKQKKAPPLIAE